MGLSTDPEKRKRQLETLAAGRRIAAERRAAGLPTKQSEKRRQSRVVDDDYAAGGKPRTPAPEPARKPRKPAAKAGKRQPIQGGTGGPTPPPADGAGAGKRDLLGTVADILGAR